MYAFGSTDLNRPVPTYLKQSQFAVGGLVGYELGPFSVQAYSTSLQPAAAIALPAAVWAERV